MNYDELKPLDLIIIVMVILIEYLLKYICYKLIIIFIIRIFTTKLYRRIST